MSCFKQLSTMLVQVVLAALLGASISLSSTAKAQTLNDPAVSGMQILPRVEGCDVPGGLQPITSSDGPNDAMFWCGTPPYCLTMPVGSPERCHIIPGSRNGGANAVRDPEDLRCDVTGTQPVAGRCPVGPTVLGRLNNWQYMTISQGSGVILFIESENTDTLSMACTGPNAGVAPFNRTNWTAERNRKYYSSVITINNLGITECVITAVGGGQTVTTDIRLTVNPPGVNSPQVFASISPGTVTQGDGQTIRVTTRVANATNLAWSCSGAWTFGSTTRSPTTSNHTTNHAQTSRARSGVVTNCVFTAVGPGGIIKTQASWRVNPPPDCPRRSVTWRVHSNTCGGTATATRHDGIRDVMDGPDKGVFKCVAGSYYFHSGFCGGVHSSSPVPSDPTPSGTFVAPANTGYGTGTAMVSTWIEDTGGGDGGSGGCGDGDGGGACGPY